MSLLRTPAAFRPACMSPGCSANCSFGYSCHERRMGRDAPASWPIVAVAFFILAALIV